MACEVEGGGIFFCQETVDFLADRLAYTLGPETAEALRADPLPLEIGFFVLIALAAAVNIKLFGWWRNRW